MMIMIMVMVMIMIIISILFKCTKPQFFFFV